MEEVVYFLCIQAKDMSLKKCEMHKINHKRAKSGQLILYLSSFFFLTGNVANVWGLFLLPK